MELTASGTFAVISMIAWLFAEGAQIMKNYREKSVEGLSAKFVFQWLTGDVLNILGNFLTHRMLFQKILATYYLTVDIILFFQVFYYAGRPREHRESFYVSHDISAQEYQTIHHDSTQGMTSKFKGHRVLSIVVQLCIWAIPFTAASSPSQNISAIAEKSLTFKIGEICGWLAVVYYFSSRFPQMFENARNKSTEGVSKQMFCLIITGELFNILSVVTFGDKGGDTREYFIEQGPFLVGICCALACDVFVMCQYAYYDVYVPANSRKKRMTEVIEGIPVDVEVQVVETSTLLKK